ncbi:hypothetical protein [Methylobacterium soli]|uniref:Uncharacterized protein n=1 Tax=Methylobacterium soli TaxID=553447 RepID=A0A6L3T3J5_9HYPH|nr:hypothetical protein [Methylobacterium soli]KAB1081399.1 hypothetical protein F6X53_03590 [Methylobacterium soli]
MAGRFRVDQSLIALRQVGHRRLVLRRGNAGPRNPAGPSLGLTMGRGRDHAGWIAPADAADITVERGRIGRHQKAPCTGSVLPDDQAHPLDS